MSLKLRYLFALAPALVAVLAVALTAPLASAQSGWPTRPVKFILTLGPGSGADIEARLIADRLAQRWGQPVIVENRPGGDGIVAINAFVSANDDHVLLFSPTSSFTAHPFLHDDLPHKPSDLAPIARVSNTIVSISAPSISSWRWRVPSPASSIGPASPEHWISCSPAGCSRKA
jgi:tripartite-type tricarboxylate transporter receptor subunit TctC